MDFLSAKGVYMKMNIASQLRRDCLGFFTHIYPKAAWRDDLQRKIPKNSEAEHVHTGY